MYRKIAFITTLLAFAGGVSWSAQAADYSLQANNAPLSLGTHSYFGGDYSAGGQATSISDVYTFSTIVDTSLNGTVVNYPYPGFLSNNLTIALDNAAGTQSLISGPASASVFLADLKPGNYSLVVSGATGAGTVGGLYSFSASLGNPILSAVPIPGAIVLFGSGLVGLAALGRRKAKVQSA